MTTDSGKNYSANLLSIIFQKLRYFPDLIFKIFDLFWALKVHILPHWIRKWPSLGLPLAQMFGSARRRPLELLAPSSDVSAPHRQKALRHLSGPWRPGYLETRLASKWSRITLIRWNFQGSLTRALEIVWTYLQLSKKATWALNNFNFLLTINMI